MGMRTGSIYCESNDASGVWSSEYVSFCSMIFKTMQCLNYLSFYIANHLSLWAENDTAIYN